MPFRRPMPPPAETGNPFYPGSIAAARAVQDELRLRLDLADRYAPLRTIAGVDVGYDLAANASLASVVVLSFPDLVPVDAAKAVLPTGFPYVPGLLSFREIPVLLEALAKLEAPPDLLMVDGQGIAHPRRVGIATHLGLVTDLPAIGVAKSRLCGSHDEPGPRKGDRALLRDGEERIGTVLRSRDGVRPLYVSPGHRVGHDSAVEIVLACLTRYRLPEPTRLADRYSKKGAGELRI